MEPAPISPSPPELLTDEASFHPLHQTIPPDMTGKEIPKSWQILFIARVLEGKVSRFGITVWAKLRGFGLIRITQVCF
jgi:hypothetical protein